jgi:hypothetical protein
VQIGRFGESAQVKPRKVALPKANGPNVHDLKSNLLSRRERGFDSRWDHQKINRLAADVSTSVPSGAKQVLFL